MRAVDLLHNKQKPKSNLVSVHFVRVMTETLLQTELIGQVWQ